MEAPDIRSKERDEDASLCGFNTFLNVVKDVEFARNRFVIDFDVGGIAQEEADTGVAKGFKASQICLCADHGRVIDAPIARVNDAPDGGFEGKGKAAGDRMAYVDKFDAHIAKFEDVFGSCDVEFGVFCQVVFVEASFDKSECEIAGVDGEFVFAVVALNRHEKVGNGADMVFVSMCDE